MGMMKRQVPAEITAFKEKFFFGLTLRQLLCGAGALALAVPTGMIGSNYLTSDTVGWIIMFEVIPFAAIGWFNYNDIPIEIIGKKAIKYYFEPQRRKYKYTPKEAEIHKKTIALELAENTEARREEIKQQKISDKQQRKAEKAERKKSRKRKEAENNG